MTRFERLLEILNTRFIGSGFLLYWGAAVGIFAAVFLVLTLWNRRLAEGLTRPRRQRAAMAGIAAWYALVLCYTVISRPVLASRSIELLPLWSYYDAIVEHSLTQAGWIAVNLCMLLPIGFLLPAAHRRPITWRRPLLWGLVMAFTIELLQLLLKRGTFELFDDPVNNLLGCLAGYAIQRLTRSGRRTAGRRR